MSNVTDFTTSIPKEKAAIVERFEKMESEGWQALETMTGAEIAEFEKDIENASVPMISVFSPHVQAIYRASEALRNERVRRDMEMQARSREQVRRNENIQKAAKLIQEARDCCMYAADVERADSYMQPPIELPDVGAMDDDKLSRVLESYQAELMQIGNMPETMSERSSLIALLRMPESKAISRELKADADAYAKRRESLQEAAQAARSELERRAAERAAAEAERKQVEENLPDIVSELRERITELEKLRG